MLAVEKGQLKVAKLMIEKDPSLASLQLGSGVTLIHWALERGLDTFFKVSYTNTVTSLLNSCILEFTLVKYHISVFQTKRPGCSWLEHKTLMEATLYTL